MVSQEMVEAAARADASYAGRTFDALASSDKVRFTERAKLMLEAALAASSQIDRLQRENAELRQRLDIGPCGEDTIDVAESAAGHLRHRAEAAEAEVTRLQTELALSKPLYSRRQIEARVESLEAALKPFADLAPSYDPPEDDDDHKCWHAESTPTLGDLRRARNTLASTGGEHHGN